MAKAVSKLDGSIQRLNVGIECWVRFEGWEDRDTGFEHHELGYARVALDWGISLRVLTGFVGDPESQRIEEWKFNDAPRHLRIKSLEAFPELLEKLSKKAESATKKMRETTVQAYVLLKAINDAAAEVSPKKKPVDRGWSVTTLAILLLIFVAGVVVLVALKRGGDVFAHIKLLGCVFTLQAHEKKLPITLEASRNEPQTSATEIVP